jgi:hypothetical protein
MLDLKDTNGNCKWGVELPTQCYGLQYIKNNDTKNMLSLEECASSCCRSPSCDLWQHAPQRGCFHSKKEGVWCDKTYQKYEGGKKCVPGFCDGLEDKILTNFNQSSTKTMLKKRKINKKKLRDILSS